MGATPSANRGRSMSRSHATSLHRNEQDIVKLMMPVYYNDEKVGADEKESAANVWKAILNNNAPEFLRQKKIDPKFPHPSAIVYFYNSFYARLFDIHPLAKELFRDVKSQGKFLVKMISLSLSEDQDPKKYESTLIKLAEVHNDRGVKAVEYGLVGEVLFWSIRQTVGPTMYTYDVHQAWVKIFSHMLKVMVPVAVAYELQDGSAQEKRFLGENIGLSGAEEHVLNDLSMSMAAPATEEDNISQHLTA